MLRKTTEEVRRPRIKDSEPQGQGRAKKTAKIPASKPMHALSYIDKAPNATEDTLLHKSLDEARSTAASCLGLLSSRRR
ncbi:MAG TPA: hypothetical protein VK550_30145 [Polyangiaceae bacterium]|nr:hypothetical protein [Polyangiaceae bacterium]